MDRPSDWTAFLKAKRLDRNPKCYSCKNWEPESPDASSAHCKVHGRHTCDLTVCSDWGKKE